VVEDISSSSDEEIKTKTKAAAARLNQEVQAGDDYQVEKKDENGKEIKFVQWFPSSLLSKPARSPVCTLQYLYSFNSTLLNFECKFFIGDVYYKN
jgi:hypothetical protein